MVDMKAMFAEVVELFDRKRYDEALGLLEKSKDSLPEPIYTKMREGMARWRAIEEMLEGVIERFRQDKRIKGALIYGSAARFWGTPDRLLSPEVHDIDMYVIVDGFESRREGILTVAKLRGRMVVEMDISVHDVQTWEHIKKRDLFTKQEILPKMKVLLGEV